MSVIEVSGDLSIGDIAAETGLSIHTLRYYERIGLVPPVPRSPSGHRRYSSETLDRVEALSYLRASGMRVEDMRTYLSNLELGDAAAADHAVLLEAHARKLDHDIVRLQVRHDYIAAKGAFWKVVAELGRDSPEARNHIERAQSLSKLLR